jgi:S1-C subfamily serine protease
VVFSTLWLLSMARGSGASIESIRTSNLRSLVFITVEGTNANGTKDTSNGTGFIVDPGGYVLTCNHVILPEKSEYGGKYEIIGRVGGGHQPPYPLTIIHRDEQGDLMLLKLPENPERSWRSVEWILQARVGTRIVALGFPGGQDVVDAEGSITGNHKDGRWLTDAGIGPGMSGGPAFDLDGAVVGIVAGGYEEAKSLGLLIPISFATPLLQMAHSGLSLKPSGASVLTKDPILLSVAVVAFVALGGLAILFLPARLRQGEVGKGKLRFDVKNCWARQQKT